MSSLDTFIYYLLTRIFDLVIPLAKLNNAFAFLSTDENQFYLTRCAHRNKQPTVASGKALTIKLNQFVKLFLST